MNLHLLPQGEAGAPSAGVSGGPRLDPRPWSFPVVAPLQLPVICSDTSHRNGLSVLCPEFLRIKFASVWKPHSLPVRFSPLLCPAVLWSVLSRIPQSHGVEAGCSEDNVQFQC